jgi:hypothetical protein
VLKPFLSIVDSRGGITLPVPFKLVEVEQDYWLLYTFTRMLGLEILRIQQLKPYLVGDATPTFTRQWHN